MNPYTAQPGPPPPGMTWGSQPCEWTYWAIKLSYMPDSLAGLWHWPEMNPRGLNGIALFGTREQAREAARGKTVQGKPLGRAVKITVTITQDSR